MSLRCCGRLRPGDVTTYGEVAAEAGHPRAARAVGRILAESDGGYPWWRVVNSNGRLVPGHETQQAKRLRAEGVRLQRPCPEWADDERRRTHRTQRDGGILARGEIQDVIAGFTADTIPDYQMSALLMAILLKGLDGGEYGGVDRRHAPFRERLDFSHMAAPKVDKHSTGGVGDKVSIPLVPMVAACGIAVPR